MTVTRRRFLTSSALVGGSALFAGAGLGPMASRASAATAPTLSVALKNNTSSSTVYAFVTGQAINNNNALVLLESDGKTLYYPSSPSSTGSPLAVDCAIPLGAPGSTTTITIPQIAGGRVWFSIDKPITFLLNPGPGLVEPSVSNPSDPNIDLMWDFCEFTYNTSQLYADISYVDFVSLPIAISLTDTSGNVQNVTGIPAGGLDTVCSGLIAQNAADGAGWNQLIVTSGGANLRALSPNNGIVMNSSLFSGYFQPYINQVWSQYASETLTIDTQASWGSVTGQVSGGVLNFPGLVSYAQPAAADIFSCSTGPFSNTAGEIGAVSARICAAFNRTTLLIDSDQPDGENSANYYKNSITNHYARIVHAANTDGLGYAFPYDDVAPASGANQSGYVSSGSPALWTITLGGGSSGGTSPGNTVTVTSPGTQTSTVGAAADLQISATDSGGAALTYTASGLPTGASISSAGLITGTLSTAGSYSTTVTATDSSGAKGSTSFTWTVSAASSGGCDGVAAWSATTSYVPGNKVSYGGDLWTCLYYATGVVPGSAIAWNIWQNDGAC